MAYTLHNGAGELPCLRQSERRNVVSRTCSSAGICHITYDCDNNTLYVCFREHGRSFAFKAVPPELFRTFPRGSGASKFFDEKIRGKYASQEAACNRCWQREMLSPAEIAGETQEVETD